MKLRVGVIGLGDGWESRHRPALRSLADRFEVRAIAAEVSQKAEQAAREFGAVAVDGYRALAFRPDIDAVLIFSSDWYGPLPILAACEAGKAIYCAAALDIDPEQARLIKERVEASGVAFMAEFPRRQAPATLRLKELIATRLGRPRMLFCHQRKLASPGNGHSRKGRQCPPSIRDLMELVDWCRYVAGVEPVSSLGVAMSGDEYQMLNVEFAPPPPPSPAKESGKEGPQDPAKGASRLGLPPTKEKPPEKPAETVPHTARGCFAQISCGQYMPARWPEAISFRPPAALQIACERGVAFVDLPSTLIWFDEAGRHMESLESERPAGELLLTQFYRGVTSLIRKTSDLEDAYRALTVVLAARESFATGKRIPLSF